MAADTGVEQSKDVFISYAREDASWVNQVVKEFEARGLQCWVDLTGIPAGAPSYPKYIEQALNGARTLVVFWSSASINSNWVRSEAQKADKQKKLYQLLIGDVTPPLPFDQSAAVKLQLTGGSDEIDHAALAKLIEEIRARLGVKGPNERIIQPRKLSEDWSCADLALHGPVPGTDIFSSFHPCGPSGIFSLMRLETTDGWVDEKIEGARRLHQPFEGDPSAVCKEEKVGNARPGKRKLITTYLRTKNEVFFISDPIRPYSIQIGGLRSLRKDARPVPVVYLI